MPSFTPFILPDASADGGVPLRSLAPRIGFGDSYFWSRPESDVEACHTVSVRLVSAFDAFEVGVALPIILAYVSTLGAGLAGVVRLDFLDEYALPFSYVFEGASEESIGDAVHLSSALLAPFAPALSKVSNPFYGNVGIKCFSKVDDFISYLPHPCPKVVPLLPAEPLELEARLAPRKGVSVFLEFGPPLLEPELSGGNVLTKVNLFQHLVVVDYGDGDFGAVDATPYLSTSLS